MSCQYCDPSELIARRMEAYTSAKSMLLAAWDADEDSREITPEDVLMAAWYLVGGQQE